MMPVRFASTPEEIDTVRTLFLEYAGTLSFDLGFQDFGGEMDHFPMAYAPPTGALLLAHLDDIPAGGVGVRRFDEHSCEMKRLYVRPAYRRLGLGRALAVAAVAAGRELGYRTMKLDTVGSMIAAIRLYEAIGFRLVPPYRANPLPDATFMELRLDRQSPGSPPRERKSP